MKSGEKDGPAQRSSPRPVGATGAPFVLEILFSWEPIQGGRLQMLCSPSGYAMLLPCNGL